MNASFGGRILVLKPDGYGPSIKMGIWSLLPTAISVRRVWRRPFWRPHHSSALRVASARVTPMNTLSMAIYRFLSQRGMAVLEPLRKLGGAAMPSKENAPNSLGRSHGAPPCLCATGRPAAARALLQHRSVTGRSHVSAVGIICLEGLQGTNVGTKLGQPYWWRANVRKVV